MVENTKCYDVRFTSEGTKNARQNCYETDTSRTIDTGGNAPDSNQGGVAVVYGICSKDSNSMKSDNPHSGFYEADTSRCLDANGGNPSCNQGGMAVVCVDQGGSKSNCCISKDISPTLACTHGGEPAVCVQGSMIGRKDENGPQGSGINEDVSSVSYTHLNIPARAFSVQRDDYYAIQTKTPVFLPRMSAPYKRTVLRGTSKTRE